MQSAKQNGGLHINGLVHADMIANDMVLGFAR